MTSIDAEPEVVSIGSAPRPSASGFGALAPEIQQQLYDRLAGMGLIFSGGWVGNYLFHRALHHLDDIPLGDDHAYWATVTVGWALAGLAVWVAARRRVIPSGGFFDFAAAFQVLGGASIYFGMTHYLERGVALVERVAAVLGIAAADAAEQFVQPLDAEGLRLLYSEGVTWVAVWILVYPLVVPMSTWRTVWSTLLTASTVPATLIGTALVQGVPDTIDPWLGGYIAEATIPTFICAGLSIYGSRVVYRLTQDLSRAKHMGNYELVERIGRGGMGEVWRAKHRLLARPAAIKLVRPERLGRAADAPMILKRFEREVQLTTQLTHPNTITIFDYGRTPSGIFYYVMELLEGIDLESFVTRFGPAPPGRAIAWMRQAASSLEEAHARGLIHRDIKPANLFTCRCGLQTDFLKVLDFGLVKRDGSDPTTADTRMTVEHQTLGTPAYMPPEVTMGSEADARSDMYALGCVMMWLLTGQTVFPTTTPMQQAVDHAKTDPIRPSERTETAIPADVESIVMECLAKDPSARPQSARELIRRLDACEDARTWTEEASQQWWERHRPHERDVPATT